MIKISIQIGSYQSLNMFEFEKKTVFKLFYKPIQQSKSLQFVFF